MDPNKMMSLYKPANYEKYSTSLTLLKPNSTLDFGLGPKSYRVNKDPPSLTLRAIG